jgi:hypothetical protein
VPGFSGKPFVTSDETGRNVSKIFDELQRPESSSSSKGEPAASSNISARPLSSSWRRLRRAEPGFVDVGKCWRGTWQALWFEHKAPLSKTHPEQDTARGILVPADLLQIILRRLRKIQLKFQV